MVLSSTIIITLWLLTCGSPWQPNIYKYFLFSLLSLGSVDCIINNYLCVCTYVCMYVYIIIIIPSLHFYALCSAMILKFIYLF